MSEQIFYLSVYFKGHVQGVGFRYKTRQIATEFDVTGCVKNMVDGRVFLEAEGSQKEVIAFYEELKLQMENFIRSTEEKSELRSRVFDGFTIVE